MKFIKEKNVYIFIFLVACLTVADIVLWAQLSTVRRLVTIFALLAAAHEVEEKIWPGEFADLMLKKFSLDRDKVDLGRATSAVSVYWLMLLALPYIFDGQAWLLAVTVALSFFEAIIHTAGITIHHMKKPYTPGLVTAWLLAAAAVYAITRLNAGGLVGTGGYIGGAALMFASFACLDIFILSGAGIKLSDIRAMVRGMRWE